MDDTDVDNQESGEILEESLEESKRSLTQISPKNEVVVDTSKIAIPELYQFIADHSSFSVAPPYSTSKQSPIFFECQRRRRRWNRRFFVIVVSSFCEAGDSAD